MPAIIPPSPAANSSDRLRRCHWCRRCRSSSVWRRRTQSLALLDAASAGMDKASASKPASRSTASGEVSAAARASAEACSPVRRPDDSASATLGIFSRVSARRVRCLASRAEQPVRWRSISAALASLAPRRRIPAATRASMPSSTDRVTLISSARSPRPIRSKAATSMACTAVLKSSHKVVMVVMVVIPNPRILSDPSRNCVKRH